MEHRLCFNEVKELRFIEPRYTAFSVPKYFTSILLSINICNKFILYIIFIQLHTYLSIP